jgi:hypothetical protein
LAGILTDLHLKGSEFNVRLPETSKNCPILTKLSDSCQYPVRGISFDASPIEPVLKQNRQACDLPSNLHDYLGYDLSGYGSLSELWWTYSLSIHARFYRSRLLCKSLSSSLELVLIIISPDVYTIFHVGTHERNWVSELHCSIPVHSSAVHSLA